MDDRSDSDIIISKPIGEGLDGFRGLFRSTCQGLGISQLQDSSEQVRLLVEVAGNGKTRIFLQFCFWLTHIDARGLMLDLVSTLQVLPAARSLRSRNNRGTLGGDLAIVYSRLDSNEVDVISIIPLLKQVIKPALDLDIWNAVFTLLASPKVTTPPTVFNKAPLDTPLRSTSSSQQGKEQVHNEIDHRILEEINGCVYNDTKGFYEKYFQGKSWSPTVENIVHAANPWIVDGHWTDYPNPPTQNAFLDWFWKFQSTFFPEGRGMYYTSHGLPLSGSDCRRKPDLFLALSNTTKCNGKYNWVDVRVIGELKQSGILGLYQEELVKFSGHAREVFTSQPARRFLHGFFIHGSMMELWVFDRSGPYSCEKFDVHKSPDRFIRVMAGYTMMSDEELGLDTFIREGEIGEYIMFTGEARLRRKNSTWKMSRSPFNERLYAEGPPAIGRRGRERNVGNS